MVAWSLPRPIFRVVLCAAFLATEVACGSDRSLGVITGSTPAAPTATTLPATSGVDGAGVASRHVETRGAVMNLSGSCPTVTFAVGDKTVAANASTVFEGGGCSAIANGVDVGARGTVQSDGSVLAAEVLVHVPQRPQAPAADAHGNVASLTGSCPT